MRNKKRIALLVGFILILSLMYFFQKSLIDNFSLEPERLELFFHKEDEILDLILAEEEYISEEYKMVYEYEEDNNIAIISIEKPKGIEDEFFKDKFIDYLRFKIPELDERFLEVVDYSNSNRVLIEWHRGAKLFASFLLFILIVIILVGRIRGINIRAKKDLEIYYPREIINLRISEILEETIKLVLLFFGAIFLLQWIIKFQFNIPGRYLPTDDIFDFEFYKTLNNSMKMNLSSYGDFYNMTLDKVKLLTFGLLILSTITFAFTIRMLNKKMLKGGDENGKSSI